jgi:hypothetical protein
MANSRETFSLPLSEITDAARLDTARRLVAADVDDHSAAADTRRPAPAAALPMAEAPTYGLQTPADRMDRALRTQQVVGVFPEIGRGVEMIGEHSTPPAPPVPYAPPGPAGAYGISGPAGPYGMPTRYGLPPGYPGFYMRPPGPSGSRKKKARKHKSKSTRKSLKSKKTYRRRKH